MMRIMKQNENKKPTTLILYVFITFKKNSDRKSLRKLMEF